MNTKYRVETSNRRHYQVLSVSALVATFIMFTFGIGYHSLAARLADPVSDVSIDPAELERLPMQFANWTGQEVTIEETIVRATETDAHINRRYSRHNAAENIGLYIAYGGRARELMPHRPEVCYPGAGWTRTDRRSVELLLNDSRQLPCRILEFSRGTLNAEKVLVLNYYIVDGMYSQDVSLLRLKAWRGSDAVGYSAQVQIVTSITENITTDSAEKWICDFAVESASSIYKLFVTTEKIGRPDGSRINAKQVFEESSG